jgi:hypothetical protein
MVSSIVAALFTPFFIFKNHTLFFFSEKKYIFCELSQAGLSEFSWGGPVNFIRRRNSNMSRQNMWEWLRIFVGGFRHILAVPFEGITSMSSHHLRYEFLLWDQIFSHLSSSTYLFLFLSIWILCLVFLHKICQLGLFHF